jgi:hypothetical protein
MVYDFHAIPPSTVASESAFSCGGRILRDTRSSKMLEALFCVQKIDRTSLSKPTMKIK